MNTSSSGHAAADADVGSDELLRRLEARVSAGDQALQQQVQTLLAAAGQRAEQATLWGAAAALAAAGLLALGLWHARRGASRH